jgi:hypothetical protein
MKDARDIIPWSVTDISLRPYDEMWSMNPSIHFDGQTWRCVLRCTDYAMPNGRTIRSKKSRPAGNQTKNAMVIFDPASWKPIKIYKMHERDDYPRTQCANVGYEDMRIFRTDKGGLQGIAASLHLERNRRPADGGARNQPPEQVILSFDGDYNIIGARPIRGDWWSGTPQKNWVPFDNCVESRFLYSIGRGTLFDSRGAAHGEDAAARASIVARLPQVPKPTQASKPTSSPASSQPAGAGVVPLGAILEQESRAKENRTASASASRSATYPIRDEGGTRIRGRRVSHDSVSSRPFYSVGTRVSSESTRVFGSRTIMPRYEGLRGGTQLVHVDDDAWLGIGHEMKYLSGVKYYWHTFYLVNSKGKLKAVSEPMKLVSNGIEFAAGMAIDEDRLVISFGVDDMECKIGETRLSAVMEILGPVER